MMDLQYLSVKRMLAERHATSAAERLAAEARRERRAQADVDPRPSPAEASARQAPAAVARSRAVTCPDPCPPARRAA